MTAARDGGVIRVPAPRDLATRPGLRPLGPILRSGSDSTSEIPVPDLGMKGSVSRNFFLCHDPGRVLNHCPGPLVTQRSPFPLLFIWGCPPNYLIRLANFYLLCKAQFRDHFP